MFSSTNNGNTTFFIDLNNLFIINLNIDNANIRKSILFG
ncbi:hypothetical protein CCAND93_90053 [Capnocytophaga canis]|uniref:Uncharacterized protein n=1 Tax=Capnocytophaga canis TaxID=1848903 RepID=A0A0B7IUZ0_9FLAO|nr:hypothetical protein CCAND93_90053 [Capnocytophaga canis]